jgi:hypothetical protein
LQAFSFSFARLLASQIDARSEAFAEMTMPTFERKHLARVREINAVVCPPSPARRTVAQPSELLFKS